MASQRQNLILAALNSGESSSDLSPVQAQKLFFLIDREASGLSGGPWFDFKPYDYGPYDNSVYSELEALSREGLIEISWSGQFRSYRLTDAGRAEANQIIGQFSAPLIEYMGRVKDWVKSVNFRDLVSSIYAAYPDTKANSIFRS